MIVFFDKTNLVSLTNKYYLKILSRDILVVLNPKVTNKNIFFLTD